MTEKSTPCKACDGVGRDTPSWLPSSTCTACNGTGLEPRPFVTHRQLLVLLGVETAELMESYAAKILGTDIVGVRELRAMALKNIQGVVDVYESERAPKE